VYLKGCQVKLVGIVCNLHELPETGYLFSAVPPKFKGVGTFPVRAYAKIK
jgi:arylformamidase